MLPLNRKSLAVVMLALAPFAAQAQYAPPQGWSPQAPSYGQEAGYGRQQLEQMLAPIALYPDHILGQVLMAATVPGEVVEAARWIRANPGLQGEQAIAAAQGMGWDESVVALTAFPQLLEQMGQNPAWTRSLGDAFLADQSRVMDSVQELRRRAQAAGTLRSDDQLLVQQAGPWIGIEPAQPQIAYLPYYDPLVAYGAWPWASYPPVYWRPWAGYHVRPGYRFAWGPAVRYTSPARFARFDWSQRRPDFVRFASQRRPDHYREPHPRFAPAAPANPRNDATHFEHRRSVQTAPQAAAVAPAAAAPAQPRQDAHRWERHERHHHLSQRAALPAPVAPAAAVRPAPAGPTAAPAAAPAQSREHGHGHRGDRDARRG